MSELSDTVRAGWSDQQEVRSVSQIDMPGLPALASFQMSEATGLRESVCKVSGWMKLQAPAVIIGNTSAPASLKRLVMSAALNAAIDPVTPSRMVRSFRMEVVSDTG